MYNKINLPKAVINLYRFCSKDTDRTELMHIRIEYTANETHATAVATNGHRMVYLEFETSSLQEVSGALHISASVLKAVKLGRDGVATLENGFITATVKGAETRHAAAYDLDGRAYPEWRPCASRSPDDDGKACCKVGVNSRYLADFADYLKASGLREAIHFEMPADSTSPIALTAHLESDGVDDGNAIRCIIMPMRM